LKKLNSGFTLIELMIVVTIIGILASIALPAYEEYAKRAKITEALTALSQCRTEITHYFQVVGKLPTSANTFGCETSTSATAYVQSITTATDGSVGATLQSIDPQVNATVVSMLPLDANGNVYTNASLGGGAQVYRWLCGSRTLGIIKTTTPANFLPNSCRG